MTNISEASWMNMMGLSKILLRRFIIGCFLLCIITISTLASLLISVNNERLRDEREYGIQMIKMQQNCQEAIEIKYQEYIKMLNEMRDKQSKLEENLRTWSDKQRQMKR